MEQQCWWESEQAQQIAGGWTAEKQRRHDERQKQAGDRESDWKLLMQQLEQDGISFTRSSTAAAAAAVQATNDDKGFRGGSKPETARAVGSSWSTKADTKHEKKERRRQRVEERQAAEAEAAGAAGTSGPAAEAVEATAAAPEATEDKTMGATQEAADAANAAESGEQMVSKAELQTQEQTQKKKERRRRQARRLFKSSWSESGSG